MKALELRRAVAAAMSAAVELGLAADGAIVVNDSNRMVLRLTPCDVIARVTPTTYRFSPQRELAMAQQLADIGAPIAPLEPRVEPLAYDSDGFVITFWTYFDAEPTRHLPPADYADALTRLHAGMRQIDIAAPHITDRIADTQQWAAQRDVTPDLSDADRTLIVDTLADLSRAVVRRGAIEQLLHGEPHPWNVLPTQSGPLFIDFENGARGPVEYDLAWVPRAVSECYPDADQELVDDCRGLVVAIIAAHHWRDDDLHPGGRSSRDDFLNHLQAGRPWLWLDAV